MTKMCVAVVLAAVCSACGGESPMMTAPSRLAVTSGGSSTARITPNRWDDASWPNPPSDISYPNPDGPGNPGFTHVTITNRSGLIQDFTFAIFDASTGGDHENQRLIGAVTRRFQVGETATFGFNMSDECGSVYQRDVWESGQVAVGRLYAEGGAFLQGRCNSETIYTPPPPPPVVCPEGQHLNPQGTCVGNPNNDPPPSIECPEGQHLNPQGACVGNPNPPPPSDECAEGQHLNPQGDCVGNPNEEPPSGPPNDPPVDPNPPTLFCHVVYHIQAGGPHAGDVIVTNVQDLTLPLASIYSGHIPQHALDHLGACVGNEGVGN